MSDPIFLMSSERSGTNLLRVMLNAHPEIAAPPPPHLIHVFLPVLQLYGDIRQEARFEQLARDVARVIENQMATWQIQPTAEDLLAKAHSRSFAALLEAAYALETQARGARRPLVKDNGVITHPFFVLTAFPGSKIIYLVRDARDVALSFKKSTVHVETLGEAARLWAEEQRTALRGLVGSSRSDSFLILYYEDLVSDPERSLRELCDFLGEEFAPSMLDYHSTREAKSSAANLQAWENVAAPVMKSNFAKYRTQLSKRKIKAIERHAGPELRLLGYPLTSTPKPRRLSRDNAAKWLVAGRKVLQLLALEGISGLQELQVRRRRFMEVHNVTSYLTDAPEPVATPRVFRDDNEPD